MKKLIVNADDFGVTNSVNQGIVHGFKNGIITSTSLMVNRPYAEEAAQLAKENPRLGIGLHFTVYDDNNEILRGIEKITVYLTGGASQLEKVKKQFLDQIELFKKLISKMPDHIDGHHHVHKAPQILPFIKEFSKKYQIPLRAVGNTNFIDDFSDVSHPEYASVDNLMKIIKGLPDGVSELMTHSGYSSDELRKVSSMSGQREIELQVLTSSEIKKVIKEERTILISWRDI